jgi:hypothetical protein
LIATNQRAKDEAKAVSVDALLSPAFVLLHNEAGQPMTSIEEMMKRAGSTRVIQRYGRLHIMQLARWLSVIIAKVSHNGHQIEALYDLDEPFGIFRMEDWYLLRRNTWSIYRR